MAKRPAKKFDKKITTPIKVIEIEPFVETFSVDEVRTMGVISWMMNEADPSQEAQDYENKKKRVEGMDLTQKKLIKLELLKKHYGIPVGEVAPDIENIILCFALAEDFIPGFGEQKKSKAGSPVKRTTASNFDLINDVHEAKTSKDVGSDADAIKKILTEASGKKPTKPQIKSKRNELSDARSPKKNPIMHLSATKTLPIKGGEMAVIMNEIFKKTPGNS